MVCTLKKLVISHENFKISVFSVNLGARISVFVIASVCECVRVPVCMCVTVGMSEHG